MAGKRVKPQTEARLLDVADVRWLVEATDEIEQAANGHGRLVFCTVEVPSSDEAQPPVLLHYGPDGWKMEVQ